ncbi:rho guanine nucleotide exchange factor 12-like isoform X3 [Brienomyrus brachyistius]|uniref:rho guanine nucleotide exchange factor 12-like isoform X3 n=1 Tax=Brienomyrus brachyistius TaxID=42636 RepID=UPI0020B37957|nr:rho guanine nucleotide exchange factor 12-like isoform X3 [Brienomyrus brachyistius]
MSGLQSTDRTGNILSQDQLSDQRSLHLDSTGLVQRCVIIQRDDNGFGLTVSGDNPVFVQLVKEDGAAMRAGVQKGDRIIKVNGTLVTHSNHLEVVKLIKSGSYAALTVLGRPPGSPQIPLSEGETGAGSPLTPLYPSGKVAGERDSWDRDAASKLLRAQPGLAEGPNQREPLESSPGITPRNSVGSCPSPDPEDIADQNSHSNSGSPYLRPVTQIIGAEDDYFEAEQEQINGQCSCFQSIELLKSRPAHLAVFLHHVFSQFDPAPLLCYLYAELYKQTNSKETRRVFMELHSFFMERGANLKVSVPESISSELGGGGGPPSDRRRPELLPEELHRQYVQALQDSLLPEVQRQLDDFRQKRCMGLTLAEGDLARLDVEQNREQSRGPQERERLCAESIVGKVEDVLLTSQLAEEEKCATMHYVLLSYMKYLGVKVKEPRGLEPKRTRINFLPKIKQKRVEKETEDKGKSRLLHSILGGPPRKPGPSSGRVPDPPKPRPLKQPYQSSFSVPETPEASQLMRQRGGQFSESSEPPTVPAFPSQSIGFEGGDSVPGDPSSVPYSTTQCNFSPSNQDQLQEDDRESDRNQDGGTPNPVRKMDTTGLAEVESEDDQGGEVSSEPHPPNWQHLVGKEVLDGLTPHEIKRQEVINELFYTERAHLHMLRVMDSVFYQKLSRDAILPPADIKSIFANLKEIIQLHVSIMEQMTAIRKEKVSVIDHIGDALLSWFSGAEEEKLKQAAGTFCSNQPFALELIKNRQKKDQRFAAAMQEAESSPLCRRLQLKDIIPAEMQRLTKYPLLLENVAKYTGDPEEREKVRRASECCRQILNHVNQAVKEAENKQRLEDYQRRLDVSSLKQNESPMVLELKNLDLTKRKMVHEGCLSWKVNKDKPIELYTLLLEDILVLLQKQDDRLVLRCHSKNTKHIFSPVIKLSTVLVRSVATDNRSFFVLSMSENGAQIYELMAQSVLEKKIWQCQITQAADAMKAKPHTVIPLPQADEVRDAAEIMATSKLPPDSSFPGTTHSAERDAEFSPASGPNPFDGIKLMEGEMEDEASSLMDLADRLAALQPRSRRRVTRVDGEVDVPVLPSRAEEALKSLAALRQLLVLQLSQEGSRATGLQRTTSLRLRPTPSSAFTHNGGEEGGQEVASVEQSFPEASEDWYLVLAGFGDLTESSTDEEDPLWRESVDPEPQLASVSTGGSADPMRQVLAHLRALQVNLYQLKDMERKYHRLQQKAQRRSADADENKDKG